MIRGFPSHIDLSVLELSQSVAFYGPVLTELGYKQIETSDPCWVVSDGFGNGFSLALKSATSSRDHDRYSRGLHHLAFHVNSREDVDRFYTFLLAHNIIILDKPAEYTYTRGYYAVFFADPDGIKLEVVYEPSFDFGHREPAASTQPAPKAPLKIATAQSRVSASVEENGQEIRRLMVEAKAHGASLIHFPEGALSGYVKSEIHDWRNVNWQALYHQQQAIAQQAAELKLWTVIGCNHKLSEPHRPHNSLFVINDKGEIAARYDKRWCSNTEINDWYTPGCEPCVFSVSGWRFACAICIEIQFPEVFREYSAAGVDCVLFSAYADNPMFGIQAQAYSATYNYWLSYSTPSQMSQKFSSCLIGPSGEIQNTCDKGISSVVISELDVSAPQYDIALKHAKPWRALARQGSIYADRRVYDPRSAEKDVF